MHCYFGYFECKLLFDTLARIERKLDQILLQEKTMSAELDALTQQVQRTGDTEDSAVLLIQGLATQIASLKQDPAALQALADQLKAKADALAAAIMSNPST
jgi:chromosome segregation ATPase